MEENNKNVVDTQKAPATNKKKKSSLSAFSILFLILIVIYIISKFTAGLTFEPTLYKGAEEPVTETIAAKLSDLVMSPYLGFNDAIDISIFVLILGGYLGIVTKTGALEAGINHLVTKMKGSELVLIGILMFLFSVGGTTYGMAEETIAFYGLMSMAMVSAGFDTIVASATILLGAGAGVLGSTINPFAVGVAADALVAKGIEVNQTIIIGLGAALWLVTTAICMFSVFKYALKVKHDKGSTILSLQEQQDMVDNFSDKGTEKLEFTPKHKLILTIFAFVFVIMIISLMPWYSFGADGVHVFDGWTSLLTGMQFGDWYFGDLAMWFFLFSIVMALIAGFSEKETVDTFIAGSADMLSVVLIIVVSRGVSMLMQITHIDALILDRASIALQGANPVVFVIGSYILYILLSFLIPSTSGLATVSMPVMGGLAAKLGFSPELMIIIFCAGSGIVNLITPTSGVVMGGLQVAKVEYSTWLKFMRVPLLVIFAASVIILCVAGMAL